MVEKLMEVGSLLNLQKGDSVDQVGLVIILAEVLLRDQGAALTVVSMAIGLEIAKTGTGRTSVIDVATEVI